MRRDIPQVNLIDDQATKRNGPIGDIVFFSCLVLLSETLCFLAIWCYGLSKVSHHGRFFEWTGIAKNTSILISLSMNKQDKTTPSLFGEAMKHTT